MDLRKWVKEYIEEKEKLGDKGSQAKLAKAAGISEATLSRWKNENYPGDTSNIEKKIRDFLETEVSRGQVEKSTDDQFVRTGISKKIWTTLDYCRIQRQIVCIYGDAGCGKTFTAREWRKDKPNVLFLTASPAINSPKAVLKKLARALKTKTTGNKDDLEFEIVENLEGRDITIIIDEAQHLNANTLEMVRSIKDATGIGLAMIGNAVIYNRLTGGKQEAEFAQLFSRLMMRRNILTDQFTLEDVYAVFGNIGEPEAVYLLEVCHSGYGLRGARNLYINALNNENTTEKGLKAMAREMGILV